MLLIFFTLWIIMLDSFSIAYFCLNFSCTASMWYNSELPSNYTFLHLIYDSMLCGVLKICFAENLSWSCHIFWDFCFFLKETFYHEYQALPAKFAYSVDLKDGLLNTKACAVKLVVEGNLVKALFSLTAQ